MSDSVTPEMAAHQAPPSLGFFRQEHWSGLPFPSPMHETEIEVAQSCLTFSDPMDCSLPGSSLHGIFQARVLAWSAIAFSEWDNNSPLFSSISPSNSQQFPVGTGAEMTSPSHYPLLKLGLYQNMSSALFSREFNLYTGINDDSF